MQESCVPLLNSIKEETDKISVRKERVLNIVNVAKSQSDIIQFIDLTEEVEEVSEPVWVKYISSVSELYTQELLTKQLNGVEIEESEDKIEEVNNCNLADSTVTITQDVGANNTPLTSDCEAVKSFSKDITVSESQDVSSSGDLNKMRENFSPCLPSSTRRSSRDTPILLSPDNVAVEKTQTLSAEKSATNACSDISSEGSTPDSCSEKMLGCNKIDPNEKVVQEKCHVDVISENIDGSKNLADKTENTVPCAVELPANIENLLVLCGNKDKSKPDPYNCVNETSTKKLTLNEETKHSYADVDVDKSYSDNSTLNNAAVEKKDKVNITENTDTNDDNSEQREFIESLFKSEIDVHKKVNDKKLHNDCKKPTNIDDFIEEVLNKRDEKSFCRLDRKFILPDCKVKIDRTKIFVKNADEEKADWKKDLTELSRTKDNKSDIFEEQNLNKDDTLTLEDPVKSSKNHKVNKHNQSIHTSKVNRFNKKEKHVKFDENQHFEHREHNESHHHDDVHENKKSKKEECILKVYKKNATVEHHSEDDLDHSPNSPVGRGTKNSHVNSKLIVENEEAKELKANIRDSLLKDDNEEGKLKLNYKEGHKEVCFDSHENKYVNENLKHIKKRKDRGKEEEQEVENSNNSFNLKEPFRRSRRKRGKNENVNNNLTNSINTRLRHKVHTPQEENVEKEPLQNIENVEDGELLPVHKHTRRSLDDRIEQDIMNEVHKVKHSKNLNNKVEKDILQEAPQKTSKKSSRKSVTFEMEVDKTRKNKSKKLDETLSEPTVDSTAEIQNLEVLQNVTNDALQKHKKVDNNFKEKSHHHSKKERKDKKKFKAISLSDNACKVKIVKETISEVPTEKIITKDNINSNVTNHVQIEEEELCSIKINHQTHREDVCTTPLHIIDDSTILEEGLTDDVDIVTAHMNELSESGVSDYETSSELGVQSDSLENIQVTVLEQTIEYCPKDNTATQNSNSPQAAVPAVSNSDFERFVTEQHISPINPEIHVMNPTNLEQETRNQPYSNDLLETSSSATSIQSFDNRIEENEEVYDFANYANRSSPSNENEILIENSSVYRDNKRKNDDSLAEISSSSKIARLDVCEEETENMPDSRPIVTRVYTKMRTAIGPWEKYLMKNFRFDTEDLRKLDTKITLYKMTPEQMESDFEDNQVCSGKSSANETVSGLENMDMMKLLKLHGDSTIIERQDYTKDKNNEMLLARIDRRPNVNPKIKFALDVSPEPTSPVQRGTANCPEMDILFSNLDSLSLNAQLCNSAINILNNDKDFMAPPCCGCPTSDLLNETPNCMLPTDICPDVSVNIPQTDIDVTLPSYIPYWDPLNEPINDNILLSTDTSDVSHLLVNSTSDMNTAFTDSPVITEEPNLSQLFMECSSDFDQSFRGNCNDSQCIGPDHEIHLPIKKRRVSSLKVIKDDVRDARDEISYPPTPMISIAALENIKTQLQPPIINVRDIDELKPPPVLKFKTPAQLKEIPPISYSSLPLEQPLSINHTYNNPTINYHIGGVWGGGGSAAPPQLPCPGPWAPQPCYYAPVSSSRKKSSKTQARSKEEKKEKKTRRSRNNAM